MSHNPKIEKPYLPYEKAKEGLLKYLPDNYKLPENNDELPETSGSPSGYYDDLTVEDNLQFVGALFGTTIYCERTEYGIHLKIQNYLGKR